MSYDSRLGFLPGRHASSRPTDPDHQPNQPLLTPPIVFESVRPARWEYRVLTIDLREEAPLDDERLSALGSDGWILTTVLSLPAGGNPSARLLYHFVRSV